MSRRSLDVLCDRPRVLFVGINPSLVSGAVGHNFASPRNPFWRLLFAAGLVPEPLTAADDARLVDFRLALTNLCSRPTRSAEGLEPAEIERGRSDLDRRIERLRPDVVCFVGLTIYQQFFARKASGGAGEKPERIHGARVFVVPNPSGLNASFPGFEQKRVWFERLRQFVERPPGDLD